MFLDEAGEEEGYTAWVHYTYNPRYDSFGINYTNEDFIRICHEFNFSK